MLGPEYLCAVGDDGLIGKIDPNLMYGAYRNLEPLYGVTGKGISSKGKLSLCSLKRITRRSNK